MTEDDDTIQNMIAAMQETTNWEANCFYRFYNGYSKLANEKKYHNVNTMEEVSNINWLPNEPRNLIDDLCPMYDIRFNGSLNKQCDFQKCPICKLKSMQKFVLKGICPKEDAWIADINYSLRPGKLFIGNMHTKITFSTDNSRWEIQTLQNNSTIAFTNESTDYPFGLRKWYFGQEFECKDNGQSWRALLLHQEVPQPGCPTSFLFGFLC